MCIRDSIYTGSRSGTQNNHSSLAKYDSNLNLLWEVVVSDNASSNNAAYIYDIEYDPLNDLLYVIGMARDANLNPLGSPINVGNNANYGTYFAAYNTSGILQYANGFETDISSYVQAWESKLDIFGDKLIFRSEFSGYVDFDVTNNIFYTPLTGINYGRFMSIYDLSNGLDLTGHYYEENGNIADRSRDIHYANETIKVASSNNNIYVRDYDLSYWIQTNFGTNINTYNTSYSTGGGVMEFKLDDENIPTNFAPITEGRNARIWNDQESINIQLTASDQDGDSVIFSLVDSPTNGSVSVTETQQIGIVSQIVATYTPNAGSTENDFFTFKVNDGNEDSNVSQVSITFGAKHENHNWSHTFAGQMSNTVFDPQGNAYQVGYFNPLTNFIDGTSLNANYVPNPSHSDAYIIKLNNDGELQWSKIITGEKGQWLDNLVLANDGNIITYGRTNDIATFSDGSQLGSSGATAVSYTHLTLPTILLV